MLGKMPVKNPITLPAHAQYTGFAMVGITYFLKRFPA